PTPGTVVYVDIHSGSISLYNPETDSRTVVIDSKLGCAFMYPSFVNNHTIRYSMLTEYANESGNFILDLQTGSVSHLKRSRSKWDWIAFSSLNPDNSKIAELGGIVGDSSFTLVVSSTGTGRIIYTRS